MPLSYGPLTLRLDPLEQAERVLRQREHLLERARQHATLYPDDPHAEAQVTAHEIAYDRAYQIYAALAPSEG